MTSDGLRREKREQQLCCSNSCCVVVIGWDYLIHNCSHLHWRNKMPESPFSVTCMNKISTYHILYLCIVMRYREGFVCRLREAELNLKKRNKHELTRIFMVRVFPPQFFFSSIFCGEQEWTMAAMKRAELLYKDVQDNPQKLHTLFVMLPITCGNLNLG